MRIRWLKALHPAAMCTHYAAISAACQWSGDMSPTFCWTHRASEVQVAGRGVLGVEKALVRGHGHTAVAPAPNRLLGSAPLMYREGSALSRSCLKA